MSHNYPVHMSCFCELLTFCGLWFYFLHHNQFIDVVITFFNGSVYFADRLACEHMTVHWLVSISEVTNMQAACNPQKNFLWLALQGF